MKLQFFGHDYKYAVEQMLATVFPGEKPVYSPVRQDESGMIVNLNESPIYSVNMVKKVFLLVLPILI